MCIFKKNIKIAPQLPIIDRIKYLLINYENFVNGLFNIKIGNQFTLTLHTYNIKNEYTAKIHAHITELEVIETFDTYINTFQKKLAEINHIFLRSLHMLNNSNNLTIDSRLIYSSSFLEIFRETHIPPIL